MAGFGEGMLMWGLQELGWLPWGMKVLPVPPEIIGVSIVANVVILALVSVALACAGAVLRRSSWRAIVFACAALTAADWITIGLLERLHNWAIVLLSLGIAAVVVRSAGEGGSYHASWRRALPYLVGAAAAASFLSLAVEPLRERIQERRLPPAAAGAPNVLVVIIDALRADHVSAYGYQRPTTPFIDRLAGDGILFEDAFSTSSWTLPSHASLLSGRVPSEHGAEWCQAFDASLPSLGDALQKYGYRTGGFSGNLRFFSRAEGLDDGFLHFEDIFYSARDRAARTLVGRLHDRLVEYLEGRPKAVRFILAPLGIEPLGSSRRADDIAHGIRRWADRSERPFLAVANFFDIHGPDLPPEPFRDMFAATKAPFGDIDRLRWRWRQNLDAREFQYLVDTYDGALAFVDRQLEDLVTALRTRPGGRPTIVVVTSDHGEMFREHGVIGHQTSLWQTELAVPLVINGPGLPDSGRVAHPVSLASLPATLLEVMGLPPEPSFREPSVIRLVGGRHDTLPTAYGVVAELSKPKRKGETVRWARALITPQWYLIRQDAGPDQLFDRSSDPLQHNNLAADPAYADTLRVLRAALAQRLTHPPLCE